MYLSRTFTYGRTKNILPTNVVHTALRALQNPSQTNSYNTNVIRLLQRGIEISWEGLAASASVFRL